jgi:uncharacterized membrane protein YgcG
VMAGRTPLVLGERVAQLEWLVANFRGGTAGLFTGKLAGESARTMEARRARALTTQATFGTSQLAKEGLDRAAFDTLFILLPFAGKGRLEQSMGRALRALKGKKEPLVVMFEDASYRTTWDRVRHCEARRPGFLSVVNAKMVRHMAELGYRVLVARPDPEAPDVCNDRAAGSRDGVPRGARGDASRAVLARRGAVGGVVSGGGDGGGRRAAGRGRPAVGARG